MCIEKTYSYKVCLTRYKRGMTFSLKYYEKAIEYCQDLEDEHHFCLFIKSKFGYTIWLHTEEIINEEALSVENQLVQRGGNNPPVTKSSKPY